MARGYSFKAGNRAENWFGTIRDPRSLYLIWAESRRWESIFLGMGSGWRITMPPTAHCDEARWMAVRSFSSFLRPWSLICRDGLPMASKSLFLGIRRESTFNFM